MNANITLPDTLSPALLALLAQLAEYDGVTVTLIPAEGRRTKRRTIQAEAAQVPTQQEPIAAAWMTQLPAGTATAAEVPVERHKVVYKVVDPSKQFNGQPEVIKCFLMTSGPQSAKAIQDRLIMKQKAVESALWHLRDAGCVESEAVTR